MNDNNQQAAVLISRVAAAKRYAISTRSLDRLISEGAVPVVRLSKRCVRVPVAEADEFFRRLVTGG